MRRSQRPIRRRGGTPGAAPLCKTTLACVLLLAAACSHPAGRGCEPVGGPIRAALASGVVVLPGHNVEGSVVMLSSRVRGAWYIVARVDGRPAVWVTDSLTGSDLSHIIDGNRLAQRVSNYDVIGTAMSGSETAQAAGDPPGIQRAEDCVAA
jgi:hypothetical protein